LTQESPFSKAKIVPWQITEPFQIFSLHIGGAKTAVEYAKAGNANNMFGGYFLVRPGDS
jgi:hypothetical protein